MLVVKNVLLVVINLCYVPIAKLTQLNLIYYAFPIA